MQLEKNKQTRAALTASIFTDEPSNWVFRAFGSDSYSTQIKPLEDVPQQGLHYSITEVVLEEIVQVMVPAWARRVGSSKQCF